MLKISHLTKRFDGVAAIDDLTCTVPDGCIYGLVGSNGAGKSTFLRTVCGIYRADEGEVTLNGEAVYDNPVAKAQLLLVPDELYSLRGATPARMATVYAAMYPTFDKARFEELLHVFRLSAEQAMHTFSKGMRRLTATALALAAKTKLVLFDETMDGLDPVMRHIVKSVIADDMTERGASAIVVSHSLRELEGFCDQLALLHKGGLVIEKDIDDLKTSLFKIQIAFDHPYDRTLFEGLDMLSYQQQGAVASLIVRGDRDETLAVLQEKQPLLVDLLPLSLEEVFTYELQARNYDFATLLGGDKA